MSLSDLPDTNNTPSWGTIFMGPEPMRETTLSHIEGANSGPQWNNETEAEYLERVKERATRKAVEILRAAQTEAAALREQARQEGYAQGISDAQAELEEFRITAGQTTAAVLSAIEGQAERLTALWEKELCDLVRLAVEAGIGHELAAHRAEMLQALFFEAAGVLSRGKSAVIFTSQEDVAVVADIISTAGKDYTSRFQVRGDPSLSPGSIVLESSLGLVENRLEVRRAMVAELLSELTLGSGQGSELAGLQDTPAMAVSGAAAHQDAGEPEVSVLPAGNVAAPAPDVHSVSAPAAIPDSEGSPVAGELQPQGHDFDVASDLPDQAPIPSEPELSEEISFEQAEAGQELFDDPLIPDLPAHAGAEAEAASNPDPELDSLIPTDLLNGGEISDDLFEEAAPGSEAEPLLPEDGISDNEPDLLAGV